jgi:hypothetical protein
MQAIPPQARTFFAGKNVDQTERMLQGVKQNPQTPPGNAIRTAAEAYAEFECVEADLCAAATTAGSPQDTAAAQAGRKRMDDLCAELLQVPNYANQCP